MNIGNRILVEYQYAKYEFEIFPSHLGHDFLLYRSTSSHYYIKEVRKFYYMIFCINTSKKCFYFGITPQNDTLTDENFYILNISHEDVESKHGTEYQFLQFVTFQFGSLSEYLNYRL